jgi:phosphoribosylaminoimidazolecarboxamide formyltransferase/IMP cyclohydrolase
MGNEKNALISVYDKNGIEDFASELVKLGWTLWASGGTAKRLEAAKIPVKDVAELVGGEAILGHRVVTLSREIYAGLLATDSPEDSKELKQLNIPRIDLVCVDLYPLQSEIRREGSSEASVIEQTDIGGPTLLRAAAKGRRIVISKPEQRTKVIEWLKKDKPEEDHFLRHLAATAEAVVARYALASAHYHSRGGYDGEITMLAGKAAYGENPWQQRAALYGQNPTGELSLVFFKLIQGSAPSYNNYADIDRLLQTITHIAAGWDVNFGTVPAIAVGGKHGNACGASVHDDPAEVLKQMLEGDLRAIFGGLVMVNFEIDADLAEILLLHKVDKGRRLLDAVIAPSVTNEALELLKRKKDKCRILVNPALAKLTKDSLDTSVRTRYVRGGKLIQQNYTYILDLGSSSVEKNGTANDKDIVLAWAVGSTSNSNTITLVKDGHLIGNGVGQQDRVGAAELAVKRATDAGHSVKGASAYSDSFFPFPDGPQALADNGVVSILSSSGSVGDTVVKEAMKKAGVALYLVPDKEARGFYAH